jgi:NAD(P)-dependent dehydrogenase (short-subunit alcohol dehydrogenase family)
VANRLKDKVSIVTGAGQGIGEAIANCFADEGAIVIVAEKNRDSGRKVAEKIVMRGLRAHFIEVDVTNVESVSSMAREVGDAFGATEILINNAGMDVCSAPLAMSSDDWRRCFAINLEAAWYCCKSVLPQMISAGKGSIVNLASIQALSILPGTFPYPVSKHAMLGLTKSLGIEYAAQGIRVNSVSPGYINTRSDEQYRNLPGNYFEYRQRVTAMHPQRKLGEPEDVAWAVVFLASDEARFVNAANIVVDGGQSVLLHP